MCQEIDNDGDKFRDSDRLRNAELFWEDKPPTGSFRMSELYWDNE